MSIRFLQRDTPKAKMFPYLFKQYCRNLLVCNVCTAGLQLEMYVPSQQGRFTLWALYTLTV